MIPYERSQNLRRDEKLQWYEYLFHRMEAKDPEAFGENKVSIITFNYDRSFEFCFLSALKNTYNLNAVEAAELLSHMPIIHVYGKLGSLPHMGNDVFNYDCKNPGIDDIKRVSRKIKIIHELQNNSQEIVKAIQLINNSKVICFLGFGFHATNIELILPEGDTELSSIRTYGSAFRIKAGERLAIERKFKKIYKNTINLGSHDEDVLGFLSKSQYLS